MQQKEQENAEKCLGLSSLQDHGSIGFDIDHCLVRYRIKALTRVCYCSLMQTLVDEKAYPSSLLELQENEMGIGMNYSVIDTGKGTILKIAENKRVLRGYRGFSPIDVENEYGQSCMLSEYDPISVRRDPRYMVCSTYFENAIPLLFAKIVQHRITLLSSGTQLNTKEYGEILADIIFSLKANYAHYDEHAVYPILQHGHFFKAISQQPHLFMYKQTCFKEVLLSLKQQGKFLFVVTNSHYEFMNLTMSYTYGNDWMDLFDVIFVKSGKPVFFTNYNAPMFPLDLNQLDQKGARIVEINKEGKVYVEGNYAILEKYIIKSHPGRILFLGDNILTDCYYPQQIPNWDAIAVIEELYETMETADKTRVEIENEITNYRDFWGDYLGEYVQPESKLLAFWYALATKELKGGIIRTLDSEEALDFWRN